MTGPLALADLAVIAVYLGAVVVVGVALAGRRRDSNHYALWGAGADRPELQADPIFPTFIVEQVPSGLAGLVVAGILAAMSTVSSSLNALASASTHVPLGVGVCGDGGRASWAVGGG